MEEEVVADEEDLGQFLVVVGHHDILCRSLGQSHEHVNILDTSESLLPQLQLVCDVQLSKPGLEMSLQGLGLIEIDGVHLGAVFVSVLDVIAEEFAESSELSLPRVSQAEVEGLMSGALIHDLETGVVLQDLEDGAVRLPQELEPWCDDGAIGSVLGLFTGDGGEEKSLWGFEGFEILDVCRLLDLSSVQGGLNLLGLFLRFSDFFLGEFDESFEHKLRDASVCASMGTNANTYFDRSNVGVLGDVLVLIEPVLGGLAFFEVDA